MLKSLKTRHALLALLSYLSLGGYARPSDMPGAYAYSEATSDAVSEEPGSHSAQDRTATQEGLRPRLEEVVVSAQRRTESLQDVPISVQVVNGQTLSEQNHNSLEELMQTVPGVHVATGYTSNQLFIRGVGSGDNVSFDQSAATFVDDVYHGRSRLSNALFLDLDRIEVLKGPQSTFFGNNAIAGALNIVTRKPGDQFDASARALYGMFGQYAVEGAVGGPVTDTFGVRVAASRNGDDRGWIDNVYLGDHAPRINNLAGRATLEFKPVEDFDATLKVEGSRHKTSGSAYDQPVQWRNCPPQAPLTPDYGSGLGGCPQALATGAPLGTDTRNIASIPGDQNTLSTFEDVLTMNYEHWGHTLTSVSGFYNYHFGSQISGFNGPVPEFLATQQYPEKYHQFSQELRIASSGDNALRYMAGIYFQTGRLDSAPEANIPVLNFLGGFLPPLAPYLSPPNNFALARSLSQREDVYSIFGSVSWDLNSRVRLNAGLRGIRDNKHVTGGTHYGTSEQLYGGFVQLPPDVESVAAVIGPAGNQTLSHSDSALMPSAGIQYQLASKVMAYFSYDRGFKAGGINGQNALLPPEDIIYGPEHVNAFELGIKSKWFDDRVLVNLDVFRSDYKGLQLTAVTLNEQTHTYSNFVRNAAQSRSQGVELETQWLVTKDFKLTGNISYLDSRYVSFPNATPSTLQSFCSQTTAIYQTNAACHAFPFPVPAIRDLSGARTSFAPPVSGSVTANYRLLLFGRYRLTTEVSPYFTSSYWGSSGVDDVVPKIGGYVRLDGRVSLETEKGRWAFDIIGKNLTDRVIVSRLDLYTVSTEEPRNVAAQFVYRF